MLQIAQDAEAAGDDRVAFFVFDVRDKADAAGVMFVSRVV
jgi:hypothetical protein